MIYVSLTTVPNRLEDQENFQKVLTALLEQDTSEKYTVLLSIPTVYKNYKSSSVPSWIHSFGMNYENFIILQDDIDYGPITNLLYPLKLEMEPDDIIIVCDDDHVYESNMISYHLKKLAEYPSNHAICFRGNQAMELRTKEVAGKVVGKLFPTHVFFPVKQDIYLNFPDHWHTVSYKRKFFEKDIFDPDFLNLTWNNDQLMAYYAKKHGFYFLCAAYDKETDYRPVNTDGRGASTFPIKKSIPVVNESGCNLYRANVDQADIWENKHFVEVMSIERPFLDLKQAKEVSVTQDAVVVISLTTVPERLDNNSELGLKKVIESLCTQNYNNYEVHFNIPHTYKITNQPYIIPQWLEEYQKQYSVLKIFRVDDVGPPTKFVPTLARLHNPETILLVVDDDLIYHPDMISEHIKYQNQYKDCVICYEGKGFTTRKYNDNRDSFALCVTEVRETHGVLHYKSVSYKKKLFKEDFYNLYLHRTMSDDVLVSKYFLDKNIKMYVVPYEPENHKFATFELWEKNVGVESFPVVRHSHAPSETGCNHPDMLKIQPRFYDPQNLGIPMATKELIIESPSANANIMDTSQNFIQLLRTYNVHSPKIRIGNEYDGGYVINEIIAEHTTKLISIGMGGEDSFERDWFKKYPHTQIEAYDGTYPCNDLCYKNEEHVNKSIFYIQHNVGYEKENIPLNAIIDGKKNVLLKVDTEGAEYKMFDNVILTDVVGLIMEVHDLQEKRNREKLKHLFNTSFKDLVLCHIHANAWGMLFDLNLSNRDDKGIYVKDFPNTLEFTFVHKKFLNKLELETKPFPDVSVDNTNKQGTDDIDLYWVNSL